MCLARRHDRKSPFNSSTLLMNLSLLQRSWKLLSLAAIIAVSGVFSCSSPPKNLIKPGPSIPGANLSGGYDCLQFGYMRLRQTGNRVRGTYEGLRKNGDNGTVTGKIEGDVVWLEWVQPGNIEEAILPKRGKGWWRISQRGASLKGQWGYDDSKDNGGQWIADRSEFSD